MSEKSEASVPQASGTWSPTKATYNFWDSLYIKPTMIRQGHRDTTVERIAQPQVVLAIQDTTELNLSNLMLRKMWVMDSFKGGLGGYQHATLERKGISIFASRYP